MTAVEVDHPFLCCSRHARTATGAAQLPFGAAVQLDLVLRLSS